MKKLNDFSVDAHSAITAAKLILQFVQNKIK